MATPSVLTFDAQGRAVDFEVWVDDLQLFLQCDRADGLSLFNLTSGASPAPAADADATVRSQWATRDAAARLAVRRHLPTTERAHFSQYKSAQTLYDAVVARYSSPATAALSRLMLPYLFPDLAAFPTVADLITHLRTSDTRYRTALPAEFCAKNTPPLFCPTSLAVDLLEKALLAIEKSIVAIGASRGDPRTPVFEGCSPSPLLPFVASTPAADLVGFESIGATSAPSGRRRTGKGKGGMGAGGTGGGVEVVVDAVEGVGVVVGVVPGVAAAAAAAVEATEAVEVAKGAEAAEVVAKAEMEEAAVAAAVVERVAILRRGVAPVVVSASRSEWCDPVPSGASVAGDCYLCIPPDPGIEAAALGTGEAAALGASASTAPGAGASAAQGANESALSGTTSTHAFHTLTLDSGASRSFFQDRTTLTPLSRPVAVSLVDPSGGPVLASFSTVLPCPAAPSSTLPTLGHVHPSARVEPVHPYY
ncbi:unnamed protein product [Closterium sp. NIES-65]|nr:unnamed protein product [Closterium sp. NIES-65]